MTSHPNRQSFAVILVQTLEDFLVIDNFYHNVSGPMVSDVYECENNFE